MGTYVFKLPDLGEGTVESEIGEWRIGVGDNITKNSPLVEMMTDKAAVEITSPVSGRVMSLAGAPGEMVPVGSDLVVFEIEGEGNENAIDTTEPTPEKKITGLAVQKSNVPNDGSDECQRTKSKKKPVTSPSIRRQAMELGIDLCCIQGSGAGGRIVESDLTAYLATRANQTVAQTEGEQGETTEIPVIGLRRKTAERVAYSKRNIPHFTYVEEVDVTKLASLRLQLNSIDAVTRAQLTYLPFLLRALVKTLARFPQCNATYDDQRNMIIQYSAVHVGIATQTLAGLKVPVVKKANSLDLWECGKEIDRVVNATRDNSIAKEELRGSTITVTSLGKLGGIMSTPVINYPEVAIIAVNKIRQLPVVNNDKVSIRSMMNLSSSFDHRIIDGYDAAEMIGYLKAILEQPAQILT